MASLWIPVLSLPVALTLGLVLAPAAAQLGEAHIGESQAVIQPHHETRVERGLQSQDTRPVSQSAAEIGITAMMQMLRDEGIDIDARMASARAECRERIASDSNDSPAEEIEKAVEECAVVEEGIIYARAINEMNENRVNTFNAAMAQYNAEVAEADRKKREYELEMQSHSAEVADIQRQQQQYERDLEAHNRLLADQGLPVPSRPSRPVALAHTTTPAQAAPPVEAQQALPPPPAMPQQSSGADLAQSTASNMPPQGGMGLPAVNTPSLARGSPSAPAQGRMLTQNSGTSSQDEVELAVMEATGPRIALVIGNEEYASSMGDLANPVNDAVLIGATLRSLGFDVEILTDASQREMKEAVQRLGNRLQAAGDNATGLFYYAGHGVQSQGHNFLIPVGSVIDSESDLELEAVNADAILAQMEEAYVSTRIVILDACRNMPLRRRTRDGARGLARMETPNGSFVAYSTSPGSTAADGGGIHSPFAEALANQMLVPDRPIEVTFREVRRQVVEMTGGDQVPWDSSSLLDTFSFARTR